MKLVVDTSAVIACLAGEPERAVFVDRLQLAARRDISAMNLLEARLVLAFTKGLPAELIDDFLSDYGVRVVAFDEDLSTLAFDAYRRFGKGRHAARLNMGDCAAYALAKARGWPLLYKGEDFALTDIERALSPPAPPSEINRSALPSPARSPWRNPSGRRSLHAGSR